MRYIGLWKNKRGDWIKVEDTWGDLVRYNVSGAMQWSGGSLECSRYKFRKMVERAGYERVKEDAA